jgi:aspartate/methionine/tyrosine aminotransferase
MGEETAFAVGARVAELMAEGIDIIGFHIGDIKGIETPQFIKDANQKALDEGKTGYPPTPGIPELRQAYATMVSAEVGVDYTLDNVVIQSGGKPTIFKFLLATVNPGDVVMYPSPGYPIYESMVDALGGERAQYTLIKDDLETRLDMDYIRENASRTKVFILNDHQNPTGYTLTKSEMEEIAELAVKNNWIVLADEAYFDTFYGGKSDSIVSYPGMPERTVILRTSSKKYVMPGWRVGAAIGPEEFMTDFARIVNNDESAVAHDHQWAMVEAIQQGDEDAYLIRKELEERRDQMYDDLANMLEVKVDKPDSTFYMWVDVTDPFTKARTNNSDYTDKQFLEDAMSKFGVSFTLRSHFGEPLQSEIDRNPNELFIRFAYSATDSNQIKEGMARFQKFVQSFY